MTDRHRWLHLGSPPFLVRAPALWGWSHLRTSFNLNTFSQVFSKPSCTGSWGFSTGIGEHGASALQCRDQGPAPSLPGCFPCWSWDCVTLPPKGQVSRVPCVLFSFAGQHEICSTPAASLFQGATEHAGAQPCSLPRGPLQAHRTGVSPVCLSSP
jgi:hypothetical protein